MKSKKSFFVPDESTCDKGWYKQQARITGYASFDLLVFLFAISLTLGLRDGVGGTHAGVTPLATHAHHDAAGAPL